MEPNVVFFDGICGLCNGFVNFVIGLDQNKKFYFSPLQSEYASQKLSSTDVTDLKTIIVRINGRTYKKSEAVLRVFKEIGGIWKPLSFLTILPPSIRDSAYDLIASNRYRLFGKKETCRLPSPEERERFLM